MIPEKACPGLDPGWVPVFGKRSCSTKKLERDDDSKKSHPALAHVAALGIVEGGRAQVDPIGGGKIADRDRLLLLQGHQEDSPVVRRFAPGEGDTLYLVALADDGLERLLFLRDRRARARH